MDAAQFPPDFFSDSSIGTSTLVADVVTRLIGFSAIALRFISRRIAGAKFWWDDYLILASIVSTPVTDSCIGGESKEEIG